MDARLDQTIVNTQNACKYRCLEIDLVSKHKVTVTLDPSGI